MCVYSFALITAPNVCISDDSLNLFKNFVKYEFNTSSSSRNTMSATTSVYSTRPFVQDGSQWGTTRPTHPKACRLKTTGRAERVLKSRPSFAHVRMYCVCVCSIACLCLASDKKTGERKTKQQKQQGNISQSVPRQVRCGVSVGGHLFS